MEDVSKKPAVVVGVLIDYAVKQIVGYDEMVFCRDVGGHRVFGTPDLIVDGCVVEVKFSRVKNASKPYMIDAYMRQVALYKWLVGLDCGKLWVFTPYDYAEIDVDYVVDDDIVLRYIEKPECPRFVEECRYCGREDCEFRVADSKV
ncbi:MAG: hypothetical protein ACTSPB_10010 [Candidatus Thorarchaeota archaeon]